VLQEKAPGRLLRHMRSPLCPLTSRKDGRLTRGRCTRRVIIDVMQVKLNGSAHDFDPPPTTVAELVRALKLEGKRIAVERNGEIVPRSRYAETRVAAGDELEVVAAVGGG